MSELNEQTIIARYARGQITALEARRRLGNITYGELLRLLADAGLPLPRTPVSGREATLARARQWLFPEESRGA